MQRIAKLLSDLYELVTRSMILKLNCHYLVKRAILVEFQHSIIENTGRRYWNNFIKGAVRNELFDLSFLFSNFYIC